ncbi:MAG: retropepsin-like aspartic protease [Planctomycetota bacterium]
MNRHWLLASLVLAASCGSEHDAPDEQEPPTKETIAAPALPSILGDIRISVGQDTLESIESGILIEGKISGYYGLEGTFRWALAPDGRFAQEIASDIGERFGFDGETAWAVDRTGMPRRIGPAEGIQILQWALARRWLQPKGPFDVRQLEASANHDAVGLSLWLRGEDAGLYVLIDPATWLPTLIATPSRAFLLQDYREVLGLRWPYRMIERGTFGERLYEVQSVVEVEGDAEIFERVTRRPSDTHFDGSRKAEVLRRESLLLVRARLDEGPEGWFLLDSGSANLGVRRSLADSLEMPFVGRSTTGAASGRFQSALRRGKSLQVGPMTLQRPLFSEMDLDALSARFGVELAGILGYPFLSRAVVGLPGGPALEIQDPGSYRPDPGIRWQDMHMAGTLPAVPCRFEGHAAELFFVDTGASDTLFHAWAVQRFDLLKDRPVQPIEADALGGVASLLVGRIQSFELFGHRFENQPVLFQTQTPASILNAAAGTIGWRFLNRFEVVFDHSRERIGFRER